MTGKNIREFSRVTEIYTYIDRSVSCEFTQWLKLIKLQTFDMFISLCQFTSIFWKEKDSSAKEKIATNSKMATLL